MGNRSLTELPDYVFRHVGPTKHNGDLGHVDANSIGRGMDQLGAAGPQHGEGARRKVVVDGDPRFGLVRITFENWSYKHRRARHWAWKAVWADAITLGLPVVNYPRWVNDYWWPTPVTAAS